MLILFKYIYKCLRYTRVFEMKAFLAPNNVCFQLICKLLSIKWLRILSQKRKQNYVKKWCNSSRITSLSASSECVIWCKQQRVLRQITTLSASNYVLTLPRLRNNCCFLSLLFHRRPHLEVLKTGWYYLQNMVLFMGCNFPVSVFSCCFVQTFAHWFVKEKQEYRMNRRD